MRLILLILILLIGNLNAQFSPDDTTGLVEWLKSTTITGLSDGDNVATWTKDVGADVTEGTNKPTYETNEVNTTLPVVRFVSTNSDKLSAAAAATTFLDFGTSDFLISVVAKSSASRTVGQVIIAKSLATGIAGYGLSVRRNNDATNGDKIELAVGVIGGTINVIYSDNTLANDGIYHILTFAKDGGTLKMWIDDTLQTDTEANTTDIDGNGLFYLGLRAASADYFTGDIAEVIMYNKYSAGLRQNVDTYLNCRYFNVDCPEEETANGKLKGYTSFEGL